ncbi:MAG: hypothetical protein Q9184_003914, partial [Pyrenodesmia sp. 2 TL-2023]
MTSKILYFIPTTSADSSRLSDFTNRLIAHYNPSILPRWSLQQILFRSTPVPAATDGEPNPSPPRYLQVVNLPDCPSDTFIVVTPTASSPSADGVITHPNATVISIPAGPSTDEFIQLLLIKLGPLWQRRRAMMVFDGSTMEVGCFRIRAGELRNDIGKAQVVRGVIVEVTYVGQGGASQDEEDGEDMVKKFWEELGVKGAREFRNSEIAEMNDDFRDLCEEGNMMRVSDKSRVLQGTLVKQLVEAITTGFRPPPAHEVLHTNPATDMAYTDDAVKAKLSSLNETQESIVSVAQWIMFHRRHADRTCAIWLERMRETTVNKRLTLIYLANEVVQQSKARRKDDFLVAFSPVIAEATATAYKGATNDVQDKIRRTVEVWSQRRIFDKPIQEAVESRITELDKSRSGKKTGLLGGSLFSSGSGSSAPTELQPLVQLQLAVSKADATSNPAIATANAEFEKLNDPEKPTPTPPVHAARLSALLKSLSSAESAVAESIKTRQNLVDGLEKLLATNRTALQSDKAQFSTIQERRESTEKKKRDVEDAIMRGASTSYTPDPAAKGNGEQHINGRTPSSVEPERPN